MIISTSKELDVAQGLIQLLTLCLHLSEIRQNLQGYIQQNFHAIQACAHNSLLCVESLQLKSFEKDSCYISQAGLELASVSRVLWFKVLPHLDMGSQTWTQPGIWLPGFGSPPPGMSFTRFRHKRSAEHQYCAFRLGLQSSHRIFGEQ